MRDASDALVAVCCIAVLATVWCTLGPKSVPPLLLVGCASMLGLALAAVMRVEPPTPPTVDWTRRAATSAMTSRGETFEEGDSVAITEGKVEEKIEEKVEADSSVPPPPPSLAQAKETPPATHGAPDVLGELDFVAPVARVPRHHQRRSLESIAKQFEEDAAFLKFTNTQPRIASELRLPVYE